MAKGDSAHAKTVNQSVGPDDLEETMPGPSSLHNPSDEIEKEPMQKVTRGYLAESGSAVGTSGRVKVIVSKRQQAANKSAERLLKLWAKLAEAPTARGKEAIMDEIWKSRESKPLPQDQLPTKNDILLHENYLVRQGKLRASASMVSGAKVRATDVIGVWTRCNVKTLPFRKVQDKCKYLLKTKVKHVKHQKKGKQLG